MCGSFACDKIAQRNWLGLLSFPRYLSDMIQKIKWLCIVIQIFKLECFDFIEKLTFLQIFIK